MKLVKNTGYLQHGTPESDTDNPNGTHVAYKGHLPIGGIIHEVTIAPNETEELDDSVAKYLEKQFPGSFEIKDVAVSAPVAVAPAGDPAKGEDAKRGDPEKKDDLALESGGGSRKKK